MDKFSAEIGNVQKIIKYIENKNDELFNLKSQIGNVVGKEEKLKINEKIEKIISDVEQKENIMKEKFDYLEKSTHNKNSETEERIKQNLFNAVLEKYKNTIIKFHNIENEIKNNIQNQNFREVEIILGKDLSDNEKIEVINNPKFTIQEMIKEKLKGKPHIKLINVLSDLEERHKNIKNLNEKILIIHNLIKDLNKLVEFQGEIINNIDENIRKSKEYINKGEKMLKKIKKK